jgi:aspartyl-tRNA(Asn)/glutamyl-tRNA(Gln) amidotransferase subunit A
VEKPGVDDSSVGSGKRGGEGSELWSHSVLELNALIASHEVSVTEVAETVIDRTEELNPLLGAYITISRSVAMDDARAAEDRAARNERLGYLDGIPYSIKDLEPTAGIRTTFGSVFFRENVPSEDSLVVTRLRASGGILIGKTNTSHFGYKEMTDSLVAPTARNPWDLSRTTGGSSGGAAAAVASGLGPVALGSDAGGSIRVPACLCGVYGIKPTFGLVPRVPSADAWASISAAGPIARTVRDAAAMLSVIAGPDDRDPSSSLPSRDFVLACDGDLRDLRVAWSPDLGHAAVDPAVQQATRRASACFTDFGAKLEEVRIDWPDIREAFEVLYGSGLAARVVKLRSERGAMAIEPSLQALVDRGSQWSGLDVRYAMMRRSEFYGHAAALLREYDLLLTPTMPMTAWSADVDCMDGPGGTTIENTIDRVAFTYPFNFTGMPAASVPCGFGPGGLPIGLQIVAARGRDELVLRASAAFEAAQPWADRWPAVRG